MDLAEWRERIDQLDLRILELLNERARAVLQLAPLKRQDYIPVHAPDREEQVVNSLRGHNGGPLCNEAVQRIFETIMKEMRAVQEADSAGNSSR